MKKKRFVISLAPIQYLEEVLNLFGNKKVV